MKAYLLAYNLASALGWGYVTFLAAKGLSEGKSYAEIWSEMGMLLAYVQSAAALEVVHSATGMVRSPIFTCFIQVASRLVLVWAFMVPFEVNHSHWAMILTVLSWGITEIVRYSFYFVNLIVGKSHKIPFPLFWLRYSLFLFLYPSGITGEIFCIWNSFEYSLSWWPLYYRLSASVLATYIPLGPFMIMNMVGNRKRSLRNRQRALNPRPLDGVVWPITNQETGDRSSLKTNQAIWSAAAQASDAKLADKIRNNKKWRWSYSRYALEDVRACLQSPEAALANAKAGLAKAHETFQFVRDGKTTSLKEAMATIKTSFKTGTLVGEKARKQVPLEVPYTPYLTNKDSVLTDKKLASKLSQWVENGTIEQSAADAINWVANNNDGVVDLSDQYFVVLGATSAMGPLDILLKYGANVIAVDLNRDFIWKKIFTKVRASSGTLIFPYESKDDRDFTEMDEDELAKCAGSNLLSQTPEIANWLCTVAPGKQLTVGNYTYLDGALHVQLSVACDTIIERLCQERKDTCVAFLCTPTDIHVIPQEAHEAAIQNRKNAPWWMSLFKGGKRLINNDIEPVVTKSGETIHLVDGLTPAQGPNYALAKRMQHWRAIIARSNGHTVSSNIAPSTATKSVVHAYLFKAAYGSFHLFTPLEVMYQETSNAVMGALLIHDVTNPESMGNPQDKKELANPYCLFEHGSFHGGVWRAAYKVGSIGETAVIMYFLNQAKLALPVVAAGLTAWVSWVATGSIPLIH